MKKQYYKVTLSVINTKAFKVAIEKLPNKDYIKCLLDKAVVKKFSNRVDYVWDLYALGIQFPFNVFKAIIKSMPEFSAVMA